MTGTGLLTQRCDPYGAENGQIRLLGGLAPPSQVGRIMWHCENRADAGLFRMECQHGHRGEPMPLCVSHRLEIQRRQSALCTRCAFPPEAAALTKHIESAQHDLQAAFRADDRAEMHRLRQKIESLGTHMTELSERGVIVKTPLRLVEVS